MSAILLLLIHSVQRIETISWILWLGLTGIYTTVHSKNIEEHRIDDRTQERERQTEA